MFISSLYLCELATRQGVLHYISTSFFTLTHHLQSTNTFLMCCAANIRKQQQRLLKSYWSISLGK